MLLRKEWLFESFLTGFDGTLRSVRLSQKKIIWFLEGANFMSKSYFTGIKHSQKILVDMDVGRCLGFEFLGSKCC